MYIQRLRFNWDASNEAHVKRHGISPDEAEEVLRNKHWALKAEKHGEELRFPIVGETSAGRRLCVVYIWRREMVRVITAFPLGAKSSRKKKWERQDEENS